MSKEGIYIQKCNILKWLRDYYKLMPEKDVKLYEYIIELNRQIKDIDKSVHMRTFPTGNYLTELLRK
jgi:hypothetical protein